VRTDNSSTYITTILCMPITMSLSYITTILCMPITMSLSLCVIVVVVKAEHAEW
jgi:hypothetical protein